MVTHVWLALINNIMTLVIKYVNFVVMENYLMLAVYVLVQKVHSRLQPAVFNVFSLNILIIILSNA